MNDDTDDDDSLPPPVPIFIAAMVISIDEMNKKDTIMKQKQIIENVALATITCERRRKFPDENCQSTKLKRKYIEYDRERARKAVYDDFMGPYPVFKDFQFERFFRITKSHAEYLLKICGEKDNFFCSTADALQRQSICPNVKLLMALKCLAFGVSPSAFQDYFQMGYTTGRQCIIRFCQIISQSEEIKSIYYRMMNRFDAMRVSKLHEKIHGVAGMIGCLDCMHVGWRNCPIAWQGQFQGKEKCPTVVLEAYADYNLWIWHASFGYAGTLNDINIWEQSPLLNAFVDGSFTKEVDFEFSIGGVTFDKVWLLVDGIYPEIERFAKTYDEAIGDERKTYARWQEGCRKSIERAFGVLQRKFQVLRQSSEELHLNILHDVVICCIVMHNMMVEHRTSQGQQESESFYECNKDLNINEIICDRTEEEFTRQEAELNIAIQLENNFNHSVNTNIPQAERDARRAWFTFEQEVNLLRWKKLYDSESHYKLRNAIIRELKKDDNDNLNNTM
jgi:Plant transposon protein